MGELGDDHPAGAAVLEIGDDRLGTDVEVRKVSEQDRLLGPPGHLGELPYGKGGHRRGWQSPSAWSRGRLHAESGNAPEPVVNGGEGGVLSDAEAALQPSLCD